MATTSPSIGPSNPRKRSRTDDDDAAAQTATGEPTKDERLWFEDGSIVIAVENVMFKVHMSMLSNHSEVFRDMFGVPQPPEADREQFEGCPLVELTDGVEDVRHMLTALYDSGNPNYFYTQTPLKFSCLSAMLRLGTKYNIPRLREEAIRCLKLSFPSTLAQADTARLTESDIPLTFTTIVLDEREQLMNIVSLSRTCNLLSILPIVFYILAQLEESRLIAGVVEGRWTPSDLTIFWEGTTLLRKRDLVHNRWILVQENAPGCSNHQVCRMAFKEITVHLIGGKLILLSSAQCLIPGAKWIPRICNNRPLCNTCIGTLLDDYDKRRVITWNLFVSHIGKNL